ncbi:hypothetical protein SEA_BRAYBEAST_48 [Arthrobacter phage BrayBeast]
MSMQRVCDFCGEVIEKKPKITSTESDGTVMDFCRTKCFMDFTSGKAAD